MTTSPNPLMTQAAGMFANPNAAAVPPAPQGVIDPTQHPVIKAIIQALSQGMQGFSQTAMDPRERMQRQEMDAQKAEAMARLGQGQQQLGMEQQRVGFEGQRVGIESGRAAQEAKYQTGELAESHAKTGIEQTRADQAYDAEKKNLEREGLKYSAEYGPGGLRSQEAAATTSRATSEASRASTDAKMAGVADRRVTLEINKLDEDARKAGLTNDRTSIENARSKAIEAAKATYSMGSWWERNSSLRHYLEKDIYKINTIYDKKLADAEKAARIGAGGAGGGTKPAKWDGTKWVDTTTGNPI